MENARRTARLLASVTNETEALLCAHLAADIIDAKNPAAGALGALPHATVKAIRARVPRAYSGQRHHRRSDAMMSDATARAVVAMAAPAPTSSRSASARKSGAARTLEAPRASSSSARCCSSACCSPIRASISTSSGHARAAGFAGLMLDTADKKRGALPDIVPTETLQAFVAATHGAGMFAGLAGSLRAEHVPILLNSHPDVLGFRGGLCRRGDRNGHPRPRRGARRAPRRSVLR